MNYITPVEHKLTGFRNYTESIEQFFQQRENHLEDLVQASIEKGEDPREWWAEDYWLTTETNLMRMSLFLSLYAFLEVILKELCRFEQVERGISKSLTDLQGGVIDRAKTYLKKEIGVDFPGKSKEWNEIKDYQKLRNHLAHNGLRLTYEDRKYKDLERFIKRHSELHHRNLEISNTRLELSQEDVEELKSYKPSKKDQIMHEGFLGSGVLNSMGEDNIEFISDFCKEVIETIDSYWKQLIEQVQCVNNLPQRDQGGRENYS